MVIALRALQALLDGHGEAELRILVDESFRGLLDCAFAGETRFIFYPRKQLHDSSVLTQITTYLSFARGLRQTNFATALDMDGTVVSARLMRLARAEQKLGPAFNKNKRRRVYQQLIEMDQPNQHCFDDFSIMIGTLGLTPGSEEYYQFPACARFEQVAHLFDDDLDRLQQKPVVVLHVSATKDYKQWDIEKFARLGDLLAEAGYRIVVVGAGANERSRIDRMLAISNHSDEFIDAHNRLSLTQLIVLLQFSKLYIGNDSGPMHLASATGVPVIALFGPTELTRWHPRVPQVTIVKGDAPCSPDCKPEACLRNYQCMASLTVEKVQSEVQRVLDAV